MVIGLFPIFHKGKLKRIGIFHDYFCIFVVILQVIFGFRCPLVILSDRLKLLADPYYSIAYEPFTEKLFIEWFGISISSNLVLLVILLLGVLGMSHILTNRKINKGRKYPFVFYISIMRQ